MAQIRSANPPRGISTVHLDARPPLGAAEIFAEIFAEIAHLDARPPLGVAEIRAEIFAETFAKIFTEIYAEIRAP